MSNITPFLFEDAALVRVIMISGEPWFVAVDVCRILGLANATRALESLAADEVALTTTQGEGGSREVNVVSEPGLYRLLFHSRRPEAERVKRWLAHDVLPSIRRTGRYDAATKSLPGASKDELATRRVQATELNAATRAMGEVYRAGGPRAATANAAAIYAKVGIVIDMSRSAANDQHELAVDRPSEAANG